MYIAVKYGHHQDREIKAAMYQFREIIFVALEKMLGALN
jgi:hypothetical protein